jgi:ribosomal protein S18 acetylase RimI-like enzyme
MTTAVDTPRISRDRASLRPETAEDMGFLRALYASTRADEMSWVPWPEEQKREFLDMQFSAQHVYYRDQFSDAEFSVILVDGSPAGRIYVHRRPDEISLVDIALVPELRNGGLGTTLIRELLAESERTGIPLRIHVEHQNPARRLYERLGFRAIADLGVYLHMEWTASEKGGVS